MSSPADTAPPIDPQEEIARELMVAYDDSYGAGAESIDVHLLDNLVVVFLGEIELLPAEKTLIVGGRPDIVLKMREAFQREIEATFTAIVERATSRRVAGFVSNTSLEPLFSVEIFRLAA